VHVLVLGDHQASDRIADDARDEYYRVNDGHRHDNVQGVSFDRHVVVVVVPRDFHTRVQLVVFATAAAVSAIQVF